jgi:hypothetical protein
MKFNIKDIYHSAIKRNIIKLLPEDGVPAYAEFLTSHIEKEFQRIIYQDFMFFDIPKTIYKDILVFYYSVPQTDYEFLIEYQKILIKLDNEIRYNPYIDRKKWKIGLNDDLHEIRLTIQNELKQVGEKINEKNSIF